MSAVALSLHILVATIGRPGPHGLLRLLASIEPQLQETDALTVVYDARDDGHTQLYARLVVERLVKRGVAAQVHVEERNLGHWGHGIRNKWGPRLHTGDFVLHCDDDNVLKRDGLALVRNCIQRDRIEHRGRPDALHVFKHSMHVAEWGMAPLPWTFPLLPSAGLADTGDGAIPRAINAAVPWPLKYGGDGAFYAAADTLAPRTRYWSDVLFEYTKHLLYRSRCFKTRHHHSYTSGLTRGLAWEAWTSGAPAPQWTPRSSTARAPWEEARPAWATRSTRGRGESPAVSVASCARSPRRAPR